MAHRIVIVDDTVDMRMLVRLQLELRGGFEVVGEAGDGRAAIDLVTAEKPDAVVLDLNMPIMNGLEALPRLRAEAPDAKVVVFSSGGFAPADDALRAGAHAYVSKTSPHELISRLEDLLNDRKAG